MRFITHNAVFVQGRQSLPNILHDLMWTKYFAIYEKGSIMKLLGAKTSLVRTCTRNPFSSDGTCFAFLPDLVEDGTNVSSSVDVPGDEPTTNIPNLNHQDFRQYSSTEYTYIGLSKDIFQPQVNKI